MFQGKTINKIISITFITICALFLIVPFLINPTIIEREHGAGRNNVSYNNQIEIGDRTISQNVEEKNKGIFDVSPHSNRSIEIRGYMTLNEISKKYEIPIEFIKTRLKIPENVSSEEKSSWLRKKYNITMNDIKETITEYQNKTK